MGRPKTAPGVPTPRQIEILWLLSKGYSYKRAADRICVEVKSVGRFFVEACNRLGIPHSPGVRRRQIAIQKAQELGLFKEFQDA